MLNNKLNSFIFRLIIFICLYNISLCISPYMRKQILNYLLDKKESIIEFDEKFKDDDVYKPLTFITDESKLFQKYLMASFESSNSANPNCIDYLLKTYESSIFPSMKLIRDSSHSLAQIGSYQDCKYKKYYGSNNESSSSYNLTYNYILAYDPPQDYRANPILFSLCFATAPDCKEKDYQSIIAQFMEKTGFIQIMGESFDVYILDDKIKNLNKDFYVGLVVVIFCLIMFIFGFFPGIPSFIFKCCFKKKTNLKSMDLYDTRNLINFEKSFDIKESLAEIYSKGIGVGYDTGISFIKGLRGIFLFFYIMGNTLETVYEYPLQRSFQQYFNTSSLSFLFFFNRVCKNVFLSISAFTLCYKILCYFDNEIERNELKNLNIKLDYINPDVINSSIQEEEQLRRRSKKKRKSHGGSPNTTKNSSSGSPENSINSSSTKKNFNNSNSVISANKTSLSKSSSGDLSKMPSMAKINSVIAEIKFYNKLSCKSFWIFFFRQFYKYFLYVIAVLFYILFYYNFISLTTDNPMWEFIKNAYVKKFQPKYIASLIFLFFPFHNEANEKIRYNFFDIIILEIYLFILFSLVLFITYKINSRLDIFAIILFFFGIGAKISIYFIIIYVIGKSKQATEEIFYPSKGFTNKNYKLVLNNPLYYFASISIGLFFGLVNYVIQKSAKSINDYQDKLYLSIPILFVNSLKKRPLIYSIIFFIIFIAYFIWSGLSYNAMFLSEEELNNDSKANAFFGNKLINIYYSVDVDIFVFLLFLTVTSFSLIGENIISSFLEHEYWNIFSRPYFSFMLLVQTVGTNILYRMNSQINNSISSILFFTITNIISSIIFGMLLYILLEVPFKKINKFIFRRKEPEEILENDDIKDSFDKDDKIKIENDKDDNDDEGLLAEI